jgi:hypothetical protein
VRARGKDNVNRTVLHSYLGEELPGLDGDSVDEILAMADKLLPHVEVHIDVAFWRLEEQEHMDLHDAQPKEPGAVW